MKRPDLLRLFCILLALAWSDKGFADDQPCPENWDGATAKQLGACIKSLQSGIAQLKSKPSVNVLAVGMVETNVATSQAGPIQVAVKKSPTPGVYDVTYVPVQAKAPIVLVGPKPDELASASLTGANQTGFSVMTRNKDGASYWLAFWFVIFSQE